MHSQYISGTKIPNNQYQSNNGRLSPINKNSESMSRPLSRVQSVTAVRKKPWNRRFIYNKIPDYYKIRDKNIMITKKSRINSMNKRNVFDTNYITYQQSKMYNTNKKNILRGFNRTSSGFFSQNSYFTSNNDFNRTNFNNMISPLTNSALNRNNNFENFNLNLNANINDENFNAIKKLWNELCVFMSYREVFIIIYNQLTGDEKEQFYQKEFSELNTVKNDIKSLNYYIEQRSILLKDLYELNLRLNRMRVSDDEINEILADISNLIERLREATIDVCYSMQKLKGDMNNVPGLYKYNIDLLSSKAKFDKNYLIKMKGELSFLKEGNAKFFFNINDDRSPFLLKASEPIMNNDNQNNNNDKEKDSFMRMVPLKEEIKEHIKECNFYIYQELIAYQQNILARKKMFRAVSPIKSNTKHMISNSSFYNNKDENRNNFSQNFVANDSYSNIFKKNWNQNDINFNSILSTNNIGRGIKPLIPKINKDLFSQKLLWGFTPTSNQWGNEVFAEDEKGKEEKENEEEEESEEKSEDDTTPNELNELIEEKKSETENDNDNENNENMSKKNMEENIKEEDINMKINDNNNIKSISSIGNNENNNNMSKIDEKDKKIASIKNKNEDKDNINNNKNINEDINKYLNMEKKSSSLKSKSNSIKDDNKNENISNNNPINSNILVEKTDDKKSISKSNTISKKEESNNNKNENEINNKEENNIE